MVDASFRQVLLLRWRAEATAERRRETLDVLGRIAATVDGLLSVEIGEGHRSDRGWDAVVVMDFVDENAWRAYLEHPTHQAFVAEHSVPTIAERAVVHCELARWQRTPSRPLDDS